MLSIGAHGEELNIKPEGRTIRQNNSFIYLGGAVSSDGRSETEVRRRVQDGANAWRQVEGVMYDRHISKKLKGKVLGACVTQAMLYGLETLPVFEKHQRRLQVCENNWVRRIAGVKRVDRRRMDELREEVGIQKCLMGRLVKSRMKWAGHVERCSPGEGKENEGKTTYEMARLHRERHEKGGSSWRTWTGGWWPRIEDSVGGSSTWRQRRVATLTPEIREARKREYTTQVTKLYRPNTFKMSH